MKKIKIFAVCAGLALACAACLGAARSAFGGRCPAAFADEPAVSAKSAVLVDAATGTEICSKAPTERLQIASMVKIMTLDLVFERIEKGELSYDTEIAASEYATGMGGSQAFLDANNVYTAGELIKSVIVASANDSCVALAEHVAGSVPAFVEMMNAKAAELGMNDTYFVNCTGLPAPNQYSCARDVSVMMRELIGHRGFFDFSGIWMFDFRHPSGRVTQLSNTNKLVRFYNGCDGGKTGYTSEAGSCLAATAKRGETRLVCVVIGAENSKKRNAEVSRLFDGGFAGYESRRFASAGDTVEERVPVAGGKVADVGAYVARDVVLFGKKSEYASAMVEKEFYELSAPLKAGDKVGELRVMSDGNVLALVDLLADTEVKKKGFRDIFDDLVENWQ